MPLRIRANPSGFRTYSRTTVTPDGTGTWKVELRAQNGELLDEKKFGGNQWHGLVVRLAMLGTHYRQPIDWTADRLVQARATLMDFADLLHDVEPATEPHPDVVHALSDDLNTPSALSIIHGLAKSARRNPEVAGQLKATLAFMGLYQNQTRDEFNVGAEGLNIDDGKVEGLVAARLEARRAKDFKESDRIRDELAAMGIALKDAKDPRTGEIVTTWEIAR